MKKTKRDLENELSALKKIIKDAGLMPRVPTKMDEIRKIEYVTIEKMKKLICDCQDKTGRMLKTAHARTVNHPNERIKEMVDQMDAHCDGDTTLKPVLTRMIRLVKEHEQYNFANRAAFINWVSKTLRENW